MPASWCASMHDDSINGPVDIRRLGAQQLVSLVINCVQKHFDRYPPDVALGKIGQCYRALEDELRDGGFQILSDEVRAKVGMQPVGPKGWTRQELLAYENARLAVLLRPIMEIKSPFESEPHKAPEPKEPK